MDKKNKIQQHRKAALDLLAEAETLYEAGNDEAGDAKVAEADQHTATADRLEKIAERKATLTAPDNKPAPLPTGDENGNLPDPDPEPTDDGGLKTPAQKAFYVTRYGETDAATKAILRDMHGPDYEAKRMQQEGAFYTYLRFREHTLDRKAIRLLHEPILTPSLVKKALANGWDIDNLKATVVEAIDTLGGYTVPVDLQMRILERIPAGAVMRGRAQMESTVRDRAQFVKETGGDDQHTSNIREVWVDETPVAGTAETNPTWGLESIPINNAMTVVPMSKNSLEDSGFNLGNYVVRKFSEAARINEDNTFVTGDGVGKPEGLLPGGANSNSFAEVVTGNASELSFNGIIRAIFGLASQYWNEAVWIANRSTYGDLAEITDGTGNYLWSELRGDNVSTGRPDRLRGFPVLEQQSMPDVGAGTFPILFGDPMAYMIVDRLGMTVQRYDVKPGQNTVDYEMRRRLGGHTVEPYRMVAVKVSA